jgi:hypothetical protein
VPAVFEKVNPGKDSVEVARELAAALDAAGCEYALGGAIALGFWAAPRGTLDVDVTLFLPPDKPSECVRLLQRTGCEVDAGQALSSLSEHGFCHATFAGLRIDVFLPTVPFYESARQRRRQVLLADQPIMIWDAETLCIFKLMFFRRKDLADLEQLLRVQGSHLDTDWVTQQIIAIYGQRDPRVSEWKSLLDEAR